jgi:two-component system, response regulator YesN
MISLRTAVPKPVFRALADRYGKKTGLPLLLIDRRGRIEHRLGECSLCERLLGRADRGHRETCRSKMIKAVEEAARWGEGYITNCPSGLIMFAVPIVQERQLLGGLVSGFAASPEMKKDIGQEILDKLKAGRPGVPARIRKPLKPRVVSLRRIREDVSLLMKMTRDFQISDVAFLEERREKNAQQFKIAGFFEEIKKSGPNVARRILDKEEEILQKVKLGDKPGAREILNEFLGSIFFESGMNFDIIKVRAIELIVMISRAAMEAGVDARGLLGLNYSFLTDLNGATDLDELVSRVSDILENFIVKVSATKDKKRKVRIRQIREFIEKNFTKKITAREAAAAGGLSVSRALHLIREETGLSLSEFVSRMRVDYSKYLLLNTDVPIVNLATEAGFFDQSHFTRTFKKAEKLTPFQFRRKYRPAGDFVLQNIMK